MGESKREGILIAAGVISALTAILSGVQTFLNYTELSVKLHRSEDRTRPGVLTRVARPFGAPPIGFTEGKPPFES
jgi:hypothetical protein